MVAKVSLGGGLSVNILRGLVLQLFNPFGVGPTLNVGEGSVLSAILDYMNSITGSVFGLSSRLNPLYLLAMIPLVWLIYKHCGKFWSHIFISPAQHQIHHSLAHKHWDENYGEVFAIWDWAFGTLYVPETIEVLEFAFSTPDGKRIAQSYPTAADVLCGLFCEAAEYLNTPRETLVVEGTS